MNKEKEIVVQQAEDVFAGFDAQTPKVEQSVLPEEMQAVSNQQSFFADKGAEGIRILWIIMIIFVVFLVIALPHVSSAGLLIFLAIVNLMRANKRIKYPIVEIDRQNQVLTLASQKFLFDEVKTWEVEPKQVVFSLLPADASSEQELITVKIPTREMEDQVKEEMLSALEGILGRSRKQ